jgi:hypothetical protein
VTHPQLAQERSPSRRGEGSREVELCPTCPPALDVGTAAPALDQVEVEERLVPHVKDVGFGFLSIAVGARRARDRVVTIEAQPGATRW